MKRLLSVMLSCALLLTCISGLSLIVSAEPLQVDFGGRINCTDFTELARPEGDNYQRLENGNVDIGYNSAGDYINFEVDILNSATYDIVAALGTGNSDATVQLRDADTEEVYGSVVVPQTGWGADAYQFYTFEGVELEAGVQTLQIYFAQSSANFWYMELNPVLDSYDLPDPSWNNDNFSIVDDFQGVRCMKFTSGGAFSYNNGAINNALGVSEEGALADLKITMTVYREGDGGWMHFNTLDENGGSAPSLSGTPNDSGFGTLDEYGVQTGVWKNISVTREDQQFNGSYDNLYVAMNALDNGATVYICQIVYIATLADGTMLQGVWGQPAPDYIFVNLSADGDDMTFSGQAYTEIYSDSGNYRWQDGHLGWASANDYTTYDLYMINDGYYTFSFECGAEGAPSIEVYEITGSGDVLKGSAGVPNIGWSAYEWSETAPIQFDAGEHLIRVKLKNGGCNIRNIKVTYYSESQKQIGYIDFTGATVDAQYMSYSSTNVASIVEFDGMNALKVSRDGGNFDVTFLAGGGATAPVTVFDQDVTIMLEAYVDTNDWGTRFCFQTTDVFMFGRGHSGNGTNFEGYPFDGGGNQPGWYVMRFDLTDNATTSFKFGGWYNGHSMLDETQNSAIYIRKVVLCTTDMVEENALPTLDDGAFLDFNNGFCKYDLFDRMTTRPTSYNVNRWWMGDGDGVSEIAEVDGKYAMTTDRNFIYVNVDDDLFAGQTNVGITVTYYDNGGGNLGLNYDGVDGPWQSAAIAAIEDTDTWKTATLYLTDADFQNTANGADFRLITNDGSISVARIEVFLGSADDLRVKHSLTLNGDIGINFYMENLPAGAVVTLNGEPATLQTNANGTFVSYNVVAKEMGTAVTLTITQDNTELYTEDYCVNDYLETASNETDANLVALAAAMKAYGVAAASFFAGEEVAAVDGPSAADLLAYKATKISSKYAGISLVLETETALRFYFRLDDGDVLTVENTDASAYTVEQNGNYTYVSINNIPAANLGTNYTVLLNGEAAATASALSYAYSALKSSDVNLQNMAKALYNYYEAADAFFI